MFLTMLEKCLMEKNFPLQPILLKINKGNFLGLLCINFDTTKHKLIAQEILQLANIKLPIIKMVSEHSK